MVGRISVVIPTYNRGALLEEVAASDPAGLCPLVEKGRRLMLANRDRWEQSTTGSLHRRRRFS